MTEKSERDRHAIGQFIREVRARIWTWDPIGLAEMGAPEDEYDCLVGPVTGALREHLSADDMADRMRVQVIDHFGVEPSGTEAFSVGILAWYDESAGSILG
jgi:hypothetical protein